MLDMEKTDEQLVADYREGDEAALTVLVDRHVKAIYNFAYRRTGRPEEAEDITQETFMKAWRSIAKFDVHQNFRVWLFRIARNTAIDWLRKRKNVAISEFDDEEGENPLLATLVDTGPLPDELAAMAEDVAFVEKVIADLPPLYREVLLLRYQGNFSFEEIGNILEKPLDTVKSQYRRALGMLRRVIERDAPQWPGTS